MANVVATWSNGNGTVSSKWCLFMVHFLLLELSARELTRATAGLVRRDNSTIGKSV